MNIKSEKEEINNIKHEVHELQEQSSVMSLLNDYKKANERMFKIIVILIICWLLQSLILYSILK